MSLRLDSDLLTLHTTHPFIIARGGKSEYHSVLVRITDDDGVEGWGEAAATGFYGETIDTVQAALPTYATLLGDDPFALETIERRLEATLPGNASARVAISTALHDLVGKRLGIPLCRYWGLDRARAPQSTFTIGIDTQDMVAVFQIEVPFAPAGEREFQYGPQCIHLGIVAHRGLEYKHFLGSG